MSRRRYVGFQPVISAQIVLSVFVGVAGVSRATFAGKKQLIAQGDNRYSVAVRANFKPEDLSALEVTSADAQGYCELFRAGSRRLWRLTNGQHYFENVTFSYGAQEADVFFVYGSRSYANGSRLMLHVNSSPSGADTATVGELLHEWGHYFYDLPDEYLETAHGKFQMGYCTDSRYASWPTTAAARMNGARTPRMSPTTKMVAAWPTSPR